MRSARVVLQAMLQGIIQGAGPIGCYYKVLTRCFVLGVMFTGRARRILLVLVIPGF